MNESTLRAPGIGRIIEGFPYAERYCAYCEELLSLSNAAHIYDAPEHYKAMLVCYNTECGYYDEECREAYVRVYYSSQMAYDKLEAIMLKMYRPKKS